MKDDTRESVDEGRRAFLRNALRWTAALVLGGGLAALTHGSGDACPLPCAVCRDWAGCRKPSRDAQAQGPGK
jgi:hypothetical protein